MSPQISIKGRLRYLPVRFPANTSAYLRSRFWVAGAILTIYETCCKKITKRAGGHVPMN